MDYANFADILEYIPVCNTEVIDVNRTIIREIKQYIYLSQREKFIVSLSGGVDSMVLAVILKLLNAHVICIHINYNNRPETIKEAEFIQYWCENMKFDLVVHNIDDIHRANSKRADYETITKNIRFDLYKKVMRENDCCEILLGHHKDDIIENVFNNICRGRNILDLSVLKLNSTIKNVIISRPLLNIHKDSIYEYAHDYNIPYFKDTTPDWSLRGIFRRKILPLLTSAYSKNIGNNILNVSDQSDDWNSLIEEKIIDPFLATITYNSKTVEMNIKDHITFPCCFWKNIFMRIFYQHGYSIPSRKSINGFIEIINSNKIQNLYKLDKLTIQLSQYCNAIVKYNYQVLLEFV